MLDDHLTLDIMGNKALTLSLLKEKGVATPRFASFTMRSLELAEAFLSAHDCPVVVKPASGTGGGRGVTTGITDISGLRRACRLAARFDGDLLVEEQVEGASYRLLFLDGQFVDAVRRDRPVVVGNGRHSIRRLVRTENEKRLLARPITALSPLRIDRDAINHLKTLGLTPSSKPAPGAIVDVKSAVNENDAQQNHTVLDQVHPETVALGQRLAFDLGVRFAGLDLICRDIRAPLTRSNGCINEINTTPGIHHHYLVAEPGRRVPVAEYLLEYLFSRRQGVMHLASDTPAPNAVVSVHDIYEREPTYPHALHAFR